VRIDDRNNNPSRKPGLKLFLPGNMLPSSQKTQECLSTSKTTKDVGKKHVLRQWPSNYYGNELVCEVSLQQLREAIQSDGQKPDMSVLLLGRRCETFGLNVEHAGDCRLASLFAWLR
jgi:hypothetical protein